MKKSLLVLALSTFTSLTLVSLNVMAQNQSPDTTQMPNSVSSTPLPLAQKGPENVPGVITQSFRIQAQVVQADKTATLQLNASNNSPNSTHLDAGGLSIDMIAAPTVLQENAINSSINYHLRSVDTTTGKVFDKEGKVVVPFNQVTQVAFNEGTINFTIQKNVMQPNPIGVPGVQPVNQ